MPEEVPFQIVTRSARRRALANLGQTQDAGANASTANVPTVMAAPTPGLRARTTARRRRTRSAATEQPGNSRPSAYGQLRLPKTPRARRRRPAQCARRARHPPITPRAVDGRGDANARVVETPQPIERDVVEGHNQVVQGPLILNDAFSTQMEEANDYQYEDQPMQNQPEQHQQIDGGSPNGDLSAVSEPDLTDHEDAGGMIGWMAARPSGPTLVNSSHNSPPSFSAPATLPLAGPERRERIILDRCTSPTCPIDKIELHERGLYLFAGQFNQRTARLPWGLSNPPPAIWDTARRVYGGNEQPGDRAVIEGFVRNHACLADGPPYGGL